MNKRLIKIAHLVAVSVFALAGMLVAAQQNSNQNTQNMNSGGGRQNRNANDNTGGNDNAGMTDRMNSNSGQNANSRNANSGNMNSGNMNSGNNNSGNVNRGAGGNTNSGGGRSADGTAGGQSGMSGQGTRLGSNDRKFVMDAAMGGMMEVELGRLAVARGASDAVKQFGQRMIDDHTRANEELMQTASALGVALPTALDAKHRATVEKMSRLSGAAFDRAYIKQMVGDHQKTVSLFQREADRGANAELKSFAASKLPALQEHLRMAREMSAGGNNRGASGRDSGTH